MCFDFNYRLGNDRDIETKGLRLNLKSTSSPQPLIQRLIANYIVQKFQNECNSCLQVPLSPVTFHGSFRLCLASLSYRELLTLSNGPVRKSKN